MTVHGDSLGAPVVLLIRITVSCQEIRYGLRGTFVADFGWPRCLLGRVNCRLRRVPCSVFLRSTKQEADKAEAERHAKENQTANRNTREPSRRGRFRMRGTDVLLKAQLVTDNTATFHTAQPITELIATTITMRRPRCHRAPLRSSDRRAAIETVQSLSCLFRLYLHLATAVRTIEPDHSKFSAVEGFARQTSQRFSFVTHVQPFVKSLIVHF